MLTNTESQLAEKMLNSIKYRVEKKTGKPLTDVDNLRMICEGICSVLLPHIIAMTETTSGQQIVSTVVIPQPSPAIDLPIGSVIGTVSTSGTIK